MVFPAHAGMDRFGVGHCSDGDSVPRARGDGPAILDARCNKGIVFPAHAGMDRTSGQRRSAISTCSPRTRGWTRGLMMAVEYAGVFPAHAGMDRSQWR